MTWALDLDGVIWLAGSGIPGSAEAVSKLRGAGERVVFLTNNSGPLLADHVRALEAVGIDCRASDLATSSQAAASMLEPGTAVAVVGDGGVHEALAARGVKVVGVTERPAAVVVGRTLDLDYGRLAEAASAVRQGARFIATNTDATFPAEPAGAQTDGAQTDGAHSDGLLPGAGALVAFIATASGRQPEVAGKPHQAMADLVKARFGRLQMVAGDRPETDGAFARLVGARFGLVLTGVTRRADLPVQPAPDLVADDLFSLVGGYLDDREP